MKFHVVQGPNGTYLGRYYEPEYRYSTMTSGGGYWNDGFHPLRLLLSDDGHKLVIFESLEAANKWVEDQGSEFEFRVRHLSELDSGLEEAMKEDE